MWNIPLSRSLMLFCAGLALLCSEPAWAQFYKARKTSPVFEPVIQYFAPDPGADIRYSGLTQKLLKAPEDIDYRLYRSYYASSTLYQPIGEEVKAFMRLLAQAVRDAQSKESEAQAITQYNMLVADHLAHLGIVNLALSLSREDRRFGYPDFFKTIQAGLVSNILASGSGHSLLQAYDVITIDEETMLLQALGLRAVKTVQAKESRIYYNMHDHENPVTGKKSTVFVNITLPMQRLSREKRLSRAPLDLRYK